MKKTEFIKYIVISFFSILLNYLSVVLSPYTSPDDLGQLAFIIVIFFPCSALITGVLAERLKIYMAPAAIISALAVSLVILFRFNSSGLIYVPIYTAAAIVGHLLSGLTAYLIGKLHSHK